MTSIIDRRLDSTNRGSASRQKFLDRYKDMAKEAARKAVREGSIGRMGTGGIDVPIPKRDLSQPHLKHGQGGKRSVVLPGNKEYQVGDTIPRPRGGGQGGNGQGAGQGDEGEDDFLFHITEDEFLNIVFEDLELPNMTKKSDTDNPTTKMQYAGIVSAGPQNKLDIARSRKTKMGRMIASVTRHNDSIIDLLEEERAILLGYQMGPSLAYQARSIDTALTWESRKNRIQKLEDNVARLKTLFGSAVDPEDASAIQQIEENIEKLKARKNAVPKWNEATDLRFRFHTPKPLPTSKAVMFCLMDVSCSMDEDKKFNAKIFYFLLYRFLKRHYDHTEIVFIRHHSIAKEVDEREFFYGKDSGGTDVNSALILMKDILKARYAGTDWNVYGAQASDGDHSGNAFECGNHLRDILKDSQAYFYTEIMGYRRQDLWRAYEDVKSEFPQKLWMGEIQDKRDVWPLFREFFARKNYISPVAFGQSVHFDRS